MIRNLLLFRVSGYPYGNYSLVRRHRKDFSFDIKGPYKDAGIYHDILSGAYYYANTTHIGHCCSEPRVSTATKTISIWQPSIVFYNDHTKCLIGISQEKSINDYIAENSLINTQFEGAIYCEINGTKTYARKLADTKKALLKNPNAYYYGAIYEDLFTHKYYSQINSVLDEGNTFQQEKKYRSQIKADIRNIRPLTLNEIILLKREIERTNDDLEIFTRLIYKK